MIETKHHEDAWKEAHDIKTITLGNCRDHMCSPSKSPISNTAEAELCPNPGLGPVNFVHPLACSSGQYDIYIYIYKYIYIYIYKYLFYHVCVTSYTYILLYIHIYPGICIHITFVYRSLSIYMYI